LAAATAGLGLMIVRNEVEAEETQEAVAEAEANAAGPKELDWDDVDQVDLIGLEIGYGLIPLVNAESGGELMGRVKGVRKKLSAELGFLVQPVRIRDDLNIDPEVHHEIIARFLRRSDDGSTARESVSYPLPMFQMPPIEFGTQPLSEFTCRGNHAVKVVWQILGPTDWPPNMRYA